MILDRTVTSRAVEQKFGTMGRFDMDYFLQLAVIHMRNDKTLRRKVHSPTIPTTVAKEIIYAVVRDNAIEQDQAEPIKPSVVGIIVGVGGHKYYDLLVSKVARLVKRERE